jgi:hypothetical protein
MSIRVKIEDMSHSDFLKEVGVCKHQQCQHIDHNVHTMDTTTVPHHKWAQWTGIMHLLDTVLTTLPVIDAANV